MADQLILTLEPRTVVRKGLNKLRNGGLVPGVIHDHGQESVYVTVPYLVMVKTFQQAGKRHPLSLTVGSKQYMAMIKDVDFEPKKHQLRHVVFNAIKGDEKVETEVPLHLEGEIPAIKTGLVVLPQLDRILIEALPKDLPDFLSVDATSLAEVGDKITVADIVPPVGVTILTEAEHPIAEVEEERVNVVEEEVTEEVVAEGEEGAAETSEGAAAEAEKPAE